MASESEEAKQIRELGESLNKSMKAMDEKIKEGSDTKEKLKELEAVMATIKDNPSQIKALSDKVEEVIVKMNRPDFNKNSEGGLDAAMEAKIKEALTGKDFNKKNETASLSFAKAQKEINKAAGIMTGGNLTDGVNPTSANPSYGMNVLQTPYRKVHMRSILAQSPMSTDVYFYPRHVGSEGDFAVQANQGDVKAMLEEKFEMETMIAHTIAGYYRVAKQSLADIPWLMNIINSYGPERYLKAEDFKMLYGPGGSSDIKGLAEYVPLFNGDMPNFYEALLNPIFELMDNDYSPNGVLLRPMLYANLLKYKSTTGEYNFPTLFLPNQQQPMSIAGVPIIMSTAVKQNEAFVGDWGAENLEMRVREGLNVEMSYDDQDNFIRNLVTIRFESRVGLAVYQDQAFRRVDATAIAPAI